MSKTVAQHLIGVTITFGNHGVPIYTYNSLFGPSKSPENFPVGTGDQVAWRVMVIDSDQNISYPPYQLTFSNPTIFGTSSLLVPAGGFSPFLQIISLGGNTKYTLSVTGIHPPSDPTIIIDNSLLEASALRAAPRAASVAYEIYWDSAHGTTLQYRQGHSGAWLPFAAPTLHKGDLVTFLVTPNTTTFSVPFDLTPQLPLFDNEPPDFTLQGNQPYHDQSNPPVSFMSTGPQTVVYFSDQTFGFKFQASNNTSDHQTLKVTAS